MSTWGATICKDAYLFAAYNIWVSLRSGEIAGDDPWGAPSLEWSVLPPTPRSTSVVSK